MLKANGIPYFWAEFVACAIYLLNRTSSKLQDQTPQEVWSGHKASMAHLKVFSSITYSHIPHERRKKLDDNSEKCIFVGYSERSKAYKLYNPITKMHVIRIDIKFNEEEAGNWNTNDLKDRSIYMDMEKEKQIQHDDKEVHAPPCSPHSSSSSSSPPSSLPFTSSFTNSSLLSENQGA